MDCLGLPSTDKMDDSPSQRMILEGTSKLNDCDREVLQPHPNHMRYVTIHSSVVG